MNAFREGLRERGYVEGQNLTIAFRAPAVSFEQNPDVAVELVRGHVDVILAYSTPAVIAARRYAGRILKGDKPADYQGPGISSDTPSNCR